MVMRAGSPQGMDMSPAAGGAKKGHVPRRVQQMDMMPLCPPLAAKKGHVPRGGVVRRGGGGGYAVAGR